MGEFIFFNLQESSKLLAGYITLVEKEFGYSEGEGFYFEDDFYPLLEKENSRNAFGYYEKSNEKIIATIACYERKLWIPGLKKFLNVLIMGAMTVRGTEQGKGIFRSLMERVLIEKKEFDLYLLWSEKEELFAKFGFKKMFKQTIVPKVGDDLPADKVKNQGWILEERFAKDWDKETWSLIRGAFQKRYKNNFFLDREMYWNKIEKMPSVNVGILKDGKNFIGYYFCGKGKDLPGIVHEWGFADEQYETEILKLINQQYTIWDYPFLCYKNLVHAYPSFAALGMIKNKDILKILPTELFIGGVDSL